VRFQTDEGVSIQDRKRHEMLERLRGTWSGDLCRVGERPEAESGRPLTVNMQARA